MSLGKLVEQETRQTFPLGFEVLTIGRHEDNTVVLADPQVSRHHSEIAIHGGRWAVRDLDSANGTYVNGQRISGPHVLRHGDMIRIGQTQFLVEIPGAVARQDTLVEKLVVPPAGGAASGAARQGWILAAGAIGLLALAVVAFLVLRPGGQDEGQPTAEPAAPATDVAVGGATVVVSPSPGQPAETAVPTVAPPSPQPTLPPATAAVPPGQGSTAAPEPAIGYFRANPSSIETGQCARLEWGQVTDANRVSLTSVGQVGTSGKIDACLDAPKTYTLEARGAGGTAKESVRIEVRPAAGSVIEYFRVVPSIIRPGDCAQLEWGKVENAQSAEIQPEIGGVGTPGSSEVCPGETTTYVLNATGPEGVATARATLIVSSDTAQPPVIAFFTARPASIQAGECLTLTWGKVDYANEVTIDNGIGGVATPGSQEICPAKTTVYHIVARGPSGTTESELTVEVSQVQLAALPDLVIESVLFEPNPCYRATKCKVRVKVRNDGPVDAGPFVLHWAPDGAQVVPVTWDMTGLAAGEVKELTYTWTPNRAELMWTTTAIVDVFDQVAEVVEGEGNVRLQGVTVLEK